MFRSSIGETVWDCAPAVRHTRHRKPGNWRKIWNGLRNGYRSRRSACRARWHSAGLCAAARSLIRWSLQSGPASSGNLRIRCTLGSNPAARSSSAIFPGPGSKRSGWVSRPVKPTLRLRDNRKFIQLGAGSSERRAESLFEGEYRGRSTGKEEELGEAEACSHRRAKTDCRAQSQRNARIYKQKLAISVLSSCNMAQN
jgi:hypothetical protein